MEILFLFISIIITIVSIYVLGRTVHSHSSLIRAYKNSELLLQFHLILGIYLTMVLFVTLCAFNNTFWHLPYLN